VTNPIAIVRGVPASFDRALTMAPLDRPLDVARARREHGEYVATLRRMGADVIELPVEDDLPDSCFVEDCAVVAGGIALITRPGAPSRQAETPAVRAALAALLPVVEMTAPATLDGGDCLLFERVLYVGRSSRTNAAGAAFAREVLAPRGIAVVEVPVSAGLHLKSVCSPIADLFVLVQEGALPPGTFPRELSVPSAAAANVVVVWRHAMVPAGFDEAARAIAPGFQPLRMDNAELRRADSALTCLSIIVPATP
jgi:dimethylargininase